MRILNSNPSNTSSRGASSRFVKGDVVISGARGGFFVTSQRIVEPWDSSTESGGLAIGIVNRVLLKNARMNRKNSYEMREYFSTKKNP
jgi:hypothetical protein